MISQRFTFLLMLIMLVTPVTSVFSHYSSMENQLLAKYTTVIDSVDDAGNTVMSDSDHCQQHTKFKQPCDTNSLCGFSVCGYGDITTAFLLWIQAYSTYRYRQIKKPFLRSLVIPPEIKPPIL